MEQFNHKIIKLKNELTGITLDLNNFKTNNHRTISRIIYNLNTIDNQSKKQTINNTNDNAIRHNKSISLNNFKKNIYYTKKVVSLEKNSLYPNKDIKDNTDIISLSANNLNNSNSKRAISSYLSCGRKNKKNIRKDTIYDLILEDKSDKNRITDKKKHMLLANQNNSYNYNNKQNINTSNKHKYNTLDDKNFYDKENKISNYIEKKYNKDNIINIYSYNHNFTNKNRNKTNYNSIYNKTLSMIENEKNDNDISNNKKCSINKNNCKTLPNMNNYENIIEIMDLNTIGLNYNYKIDNNIVNDHPYINNNMSQNTNADLFKKMNINKYNIYNNQRINSFRGKLLTNANIKNKNIINEININNNSFNKKTILNQIINKLDVNNWEEAKLRINNLINCQNFVKKLSNIYCKYNNEKRNYNKNDILLWLINMGECFKYKSYMNKIMKFHNIDNLEELKYFVNKNIIK